MVNNPEFEEGIFNSFNNNDMKKPWWKSRTMWMALAQAFVAGFLYIYSSNVGVQNISWVMAIKSLVDIYLRLTTNPQL